MSKTGEAPTTTGPDTTPFPATGPDGTAVFPATPDTDPAAATAIPSEATIAAAYDESAPLPSPEDVRDAGYREDEFRAADVLSGAQAVKVEVRGVGSQLLRGWERSMAFLRNSAARPNQGRKWATQYGFSKYHNLQNRRLNAAKGKVASRQRVSARAMRRRTNAQANAEKWYTKREDAYNKHRQAMHDRAAAPGKRAEQRRTARIEMYKTKRTAALANKALRKQLKSEGVRYLDRRSIMNEIPHEQLDQLGRVVIERVAGSRRLGRAESRAVFATQRHEDIKAAHESSKLRLSTYETHRAVKTARLERIATTDLIEANDELRAVSAALSAPGMNEEHANYATLVGRQEALQNQIAILQHERQVLNEELARLPSLIKDEEDRQVVLATDATSAEQQAVRQQARAVAHRVWSREHDEKLQKEIYAVLDSDVVRK